MDSGHILFLWFKETARRISMRLGKRGRRKDGFGFDVFVLSWMRSSSTGQRHWLGSDVALSKSAGYTTGCRRGPGFARSSKSFNSLPDARSETNCFRNTSSSLMSW
ncbi:hypothetical protein M405DRAFT_827208 [Rhizopogon salebrosus TDB-379]|nr:hypothetical protein M405DRAFT_827208 [Rhizopogon salebrosus TDB-379]